MKTQINYLTKGLPSKVNLYKYDLVFNTDFRNWIKYEEIMLDDDKEHLEESLLSVIDICYKDGLDVLNNIDIQIAFNQILWFYTMGNDEEIKIEISDEDDSENVVKEKITKIYDYRCDWNYIYSAFIQSYNIDLFDSNLHWWKFKSLFNALPEDTQFSKILGYRAITISSTMSKEEKGFYRKMKKLYALPDMRSEEEKEASFAKSMLANIKN